MNYEMNPKLKEYMDSVVKEHYSLNDKGHGMDHAEYVINRSLKFAETVEDINYDMVYVVAAYHDVAHHVDAKNHEAVSAEMLRNDAKLKEFFNDQQIKVMSEAVEDHRSSLETEPRTIYGEIVSSADRNTSVETTLKRCYAYNKKHSPELSQDDLIEKCRQFILKKYGVDGYAREKMYFDDEQYSDYLNSITELASDKEAFAKSIIQVNKDEENERKNMDNSVEDSKETIAENKYNVTMDLYKSWAKASPRYKFMQVVFLIIALGSAAATVSILMGVSDRYFLVYAVMSLYALFMFVYGNTRLLIIRPYKTLTMFYKQSDWERRILFFDDCIEIKDADVNNYKYKYSDIVRIEKKDNYIKIKMQAGSIRVYEDAFVKANMEVLESLIKSKNDVKVK